MSELLLVMWQKCFCLESGLFLFVFYLEGSCKTWLRLTEKKNKALKLVAGVRTENEFLWFGFFNLSSESWPFHSFARACNFSVTAKLLVFKRETL